MQKDDTSVPRSVTAQLKEKLIQHSLKRLLENVEQKHSSPHSHAHTHHISEVFYNFSLHPEYKKILLLNEGSTKLGVANPFFRVHEGTAGATTLIDGKEVINYANYNYLSLSGHPAVNQAAKEAIDRYGTSVSASRIVSGERPLHRELEHSLAEVYGVEDALTFVSGHATNVTVLGHLFGPKDLILHDVLIHNSIIQGAILSGAKRLSFPHNDWKALDTILSQQRHHFERILIVLEGIYSMDGDYPDLPRFVELKDKYKVFLMVDEAHSFGVMGKKGLGIREHFNLQGSDVDIWMGTLSKSLAGCGGYIVGEKALIENLRNFAPGFLYSVGMAPPVAAASLAALQLLQREPERVTRLQELGQLFLKKSQEAGLKTGTSAGLAIVPVIVGSSLCAARLSNVLLKRAINVQPIIYPAVPESSARLRFFLSSAHTEQQLFSTVQILSEELKLI